MSKLFDRAIAKVRKLPDDQQDLVAAHLIEQIEDPSADDRMSIDEAREAYLNGDLLVLARWRRDLGIDS